tara:strand:+ start:1494 stop:1643 length:150 start_codon:yes stop_codon:yes gene_type:complete
VVSAIYINTFIIFSFTLIMPSPSMPFPFIPFHQPSFASLKSNYFDVRMA